MWQILGATVDILHAVLMATWVLGMPLLFFHRRPRLSRAYAIYAVTFILLSQGSHLALGQCFLTTIAAWFWEHSPATGHSRIDTSDWFTIRLAKLIFDMSPSHRSIVALTELLIFLTAVGEMVSLRRIVVPVRIKRR